jgi:hypothetical protein
MAVIIRETRSLGGKIRENVPVYKSFRPVTKESQLQAEKIDSLLSGEIKTIEQELESGGLLSLKRKHGVIKLWYELGRKLQFVFTIPISPEEDRDYIWRAIYDHADKIKSGEGMSRVERLKNNYFRYAAEVAKFPWEFVSAVGDWTSWVELMDSAISKDKRILEWLKKRSSEKPTNLWKQFAHGSRMEWFRKLTKKLRSSFKGRNTSYLNSEELYQELDDIFQELASFDNIQKS